MLSLSKHGVGFFNGLLGRPLNSNVSPSQRGAGIEGDGTSVKCDRPCSAM